MIWQEHKLLQELLKIYNVFFYLPFLMFMIIKLGQR